MMVSLKNIFYAMFYIDNGTPFCLSEPFVVSFVETMYTVLESKGQVEVCVHVTSPKDLYNGIILVEVYDSSSSTYIPSNAELAGNIVYLSSAKYLIGQLYNW